jgi:hypothetical protein
MRSDLAWQRQQLKRLFKIDVRRRDAFGQRRAFGFFGWRRIGFFGALALLARWLWRRLA